ncbi:hypothetical protein NM208_g714 [Fusarium decemcellulare]|uniref:Uncharacterized protein n=1 Tax=Fusarium decemcellulare TaxID=57161 RepID=A0ACC1SYP1_9HYPO|nr:hypothetical protein NM208_g714 [Fusarium decemcellulare]
MTRFNLRLIPWDPASRSHVQRLVIQRVQCGWHSEKVVPEWRDQQIRGAKSIYWITLTDQGDGIRQKLESHFKTYLNEKDPLQDTSRSFPRKHEEPSSDYFSPIGHISLDIGNDEVSSLELDIPSHGVCWIKTLYVSHALQGEGIGRAVMDIVEELAAKEPLNAKTLALDTVFRDDQLKEEWFLSQGQSPRKVANQDWYARRQYQVVAVVPNYYRTPDSNGVVWESRTVFMKKDVA